MREPPRERDGWKDWRAGLLCLVLAANAVALSRHTAWAWRLLRGTWSLTQDERRRLIMPGAYQSMRTAENLLPTRATIWWVSPLEPKDWIYFLYPRILGKGSARLENLQRIRRDHPEDWIASNHSPDPAVDYLDFLPPLRPASQSRNSE